MASEGAGYDMPVLAMSVADCEEVFPLSVIHIGDDNAGVLVLLVEAGVITLFAPETVLEAVGTLDTFRRRSLVSRFDAARQRRAPARLRRLNMAARRGRTHVFGFCLIFWAVALREFFMINLVGLVPRWEDVSLRSADFGLVSIHLALSYWLALFPF